MIEEVKKLPGILIFNRFFVVYNFVSACHMYIMGKWEPIILIISACSVEGNWWEFAAESDLFDYGAFMDTLT